jgi:hypothetical protein
MQSDYEDESALEIIASQFEFSPPQIRARLAKRGSINRDEARAYQR